MVKTKLFVYFAKKKSDGLMSPAIKENFKIFIDTLTPTDIFYKFNKFI